MTIDPETQRSLFAQAVQALGGTTTAAAAIGVGTRTLERINAGTHQAHDGIMADLAKALLERAELCRALEKQINPMFAANRVDGQRAQDGRRDRRQRASETEA